MFIVPFVRGAFCHFFNKRILHCIANIGIGLIIKTAACIHDTDQSLY